MTRTRELRSDINAQMAESIAGMAGAAGQQCRGALHRALRHPQRGALPVAPARAARQRLAAAAGAGLAQRAAAGAWSSASFGTRGNGAALSALEVGVLYAFINYISRVVEPLIQITMQFSQLQQAVVGAARVHALLEEAETPVAGRPRPGDRGRDPIERLDFAYQPGRTGAARPRPADRAGQLPRHRGPHRQRQEHPAVAAAALLSRRRRAASASTARRWRRSARTTSATAWAWCRRSLSCWPPPRARTSPWAAT